jgi:hypothetical protein
MRKDDAWEVLGCRKVEQMLAAFIRKREEAGSGIRSSAEAEAGA